jgi:hypothetical protein
MLQEDRLDPGFVEFEIRVVVGSERNTGLQTCPDESSDDE